MQSIWLPTAMTLIKLRHLQLQCYAPGVVHAGVSFGCCAAVSVRKVHRCRLTAVGVMCCAACAVLGIQYVVLRHSCWEISGIHYNCH